MNRVSVNSDRFRTVGYDAVTRQMEVEFRNGQCYLFNDVPMGLYDNFMRAEDMGAYYDTYIWDAYEHAEIRTSHD